jgi:hypothetical protein
MIRRGFRQAELRELFSHFFYPLHATCPACGSVDCAKWELVRALAPVDSDTVEAVRSAGVTVR